MLLLGFKGREALYGGAVGGGKSAGLLTAALRFVDRRGYAALLLRRTYAELEQPAGLIPLAHRWLDTTDARWNQQSKQWTFPSGAVVKFGHVQHEENKSLYQGGAFNFVGFDELTHFTEGIYLYIGFSRQRREFALRDIPIQTYASANPGGVGHMWVKNRFIEEKSDDVLYVPATIWDNPGLDAADYELSLIHLPETYRRQLMLGDWGAFEGAAYDIEEDIHFVADFEPAPQWERFEFMDHGVANPTAWFVCAVDYDGNIIVFDEYYSPGLISEHAREICARRPVWYPEWRDADYRTQRTAPKVYADPQVTHRMGWTSKQGIPATIGTEYREQSGEEIVLIPANNDRAAGHARLKELLRLDDNRAFPDWHPRYGEKGAPRLYVVSSRCPNLAEQLRSALILAIDSGKRGAGEVVDDVWEGQWGHAHAALRYGAMTWPGASTMPTSYPDDMRVEFLQKVEARWEAGDYGQKLINV